MSLKISVPSIGCASCIETITKAIQSVDSSAMITGDAAAKSIEVTSQLTETQIRNLIQDAGHQAI